MTFSGEIIIKENNQELSDIFSSVVFIFSFHCLHSLLCHFETCCLYPNISVPKAVKYQKNPPKTKRKFPLVSPFYSVLVCDSMLFIILLYLWIFNFLPLKT